MKAAYITSYDSTDVNQWSGLGSYIARSLEAQGIEWVRIGPLQRRLDPLIVGKFLVNKLLKKQYQRKRAPQVLHSYARQISERLKGLKVDFLFSPGTLELAYLKTELPMVFWTDCTFDGMVDFYPNMTRLAPETLRDGHNAEQAALTGCRLALYSSQWAAQTALDHYDVDPSKVKLCPLARISFPSSRPTTFRRWWRRGAGAGEASFCGRGVGTERGRLCGRAAQ